MLNRLSSSILLAGVLTVGGCGHSRLNSPIITGAGDWTTYGGGIGRTNVTLHHLTPPLVTEWQFDAGAGFSSAPAIISGGFLVVGTLDGEIHVLDVAKGEEKMSRDFGSAVVGTPLLDGQHLILSLGHDEESLVCYDLIKGSTVWKVRAGDIDTSPLLIDSSVIVASTDGVVYSIDRVAGTLQWKFRVPSDNRTATIHSSPASDGRSVFFGTDEGSLISIDLHTGKEIWTMAAGGAILSTPSVSAGVVYVGSLDQIEYAVDAGTGKLIWKSPLGSRIFSSQAVDSFRVYVGTAGRSLFALDRQTGSVDWKFTAEGPISSAPLISGEIVYVGSLDRSLYALDRRTGATIWKFPTEGRVKSMPLVWNNRLFLEVEDTDIFALRPEGQQ